MEKIALYIFFGLLALVVLVNLGSALGGSKTEEGPKKKKSSKKEKNKTDTQCFNGICKTIDQLENEIDEFEAKYPDSKNTAKIRRKIKAL